MNPGTAAKDAALSEPRDVESARADPDETTDRALGGKAAVAAGALTVAAMSYWVMFGISFCVSKGVLVVLSGIFAGVFTTLGVGTCCMAAIYGPNRVAPGGGP